MGVVGERGAREGKPSVLPYGDNVDILLRAPRVVLRGDVQLLSSMP